MESTWLLLAAISPRVVFVMAGCGALAALLIVWLMLPHSLDETEAGYPSATSAAVRTS